jgi:hypothetical protein
MHFHGVAALMFDSVINNANGSSVVNVCVCVGVCVCLCVCVCVFFFF